MKAVHKDDLSVTPIRQGPALWTILPALTYKVPPRHTEEHSEVVPLADCVLFAWRQDRLRRAYAQLDEGANPSEDLTRVVEYRVGEARHYLPDTDMHYAVALQRRGGTVLRVLVRGAYDLSPEAFAIDEVGVLWKRCDDGRTWEQVWRYEARLVPAFHALGVGRVTF